MNTPPDGQPGPPGFGHPSPGYVRAPGPGWAPGHSGAPGPVAGHSGAPGYAAPGGWAHPGAGVAFAPVQEYAAPGGRALAQPTDRLLARIIDSVLLSIPVLLIEIPLFLAIWFWAWDTFDLGADPNATSTTAPTVDGGDVLLMFGLFMGALLLVALISALITYLYEVVYMHRTGQTIGKRVMKIRVVRVEDGGPVTTGHARRRWLAQDGVALLALIPFVGSLVGLYNWLDSLWLLWDKPHRQCLHDKYGKTAVVKLTAADLAKPRSDLERAA